MSDMLSIVAGAASAFIVLAAITRLVWFIQVERRRLRYLEELKLQVHLTDVVSAIDHLTVQNADRDSIEQITLSLDRDEARKHVEIAELEKAIVRFQRAIADIERLRGRHSDDRIVARELDDIEPLSIKISDLVRPQVSDTTSTATS